MGNPSNFVRIQAIYKDYENLKNHLSSWTYNDVETSNVLLEVYQKYNYLMDTHGAVGYLGLKDYLEQNYLR